jgi:hypothetical protein
MVVYGRLFSLQIASTSRNLRLGLSIALAQ